MLQSSGLGRETIQRVSIPINPTRSVDTNDNCLVFPGRRVVTNRNQLMVVSKGFVFQQSVTWAGRGIIELAAEFLGDDVIIPIP